MTEYSKYNIVYRLQKWMDSVIGQTFLNYAYSWGASVVILGTLFKLTHLPGANLMLYLGMGTEVLVFFLSAFDRPFDKTTIGLDLTTGTDTSKETEVDENMSSQGNVSSESSGKVIITGNVQPIAQGIPMQQSIAVVGGSAAVGGSVSAESTQEMEEATNNYVEELKRLTTMLSAVADQSQRLTRDSEEMENLNRTLTGISRVYEMQLKSASAQMGTIDEINEQSKRMAEQIAELNKIYARMIEAVKVRA
ncbi:MAG: gliding motility protein GldL [Prevotella sp.]|nr:gliding motility protein GldL [Prevotella sp.]MCI7257360.1 gliding motility protein GldL [Prevotella sp.]MDD7226023.1 gliding motility protein GldL [Prevotella sp.]